MEMAQFKMNLSVPAVPTLAKLVNCGLATAPDPVYLYNGHKREASAGQKLLVQVNHKIQL